MDHSQPSKIVGLPENARRPLEPGESYTPIVPDESGVYEVTTRSVAMGLIFCAIFSMAAAYLALRVGQGIEAAIPIAILAIGISPLFARRSTILENVIVQSIGANSSHVVSGAVFTIPALYMLAAQPEMGVTAPTVMQVILVSFLGGCLGVLFLIPLRYHFMVEMHGQLPWPEGTATTEILITGERAGGQAKILVLAAALGAAYDGMAASFHAWADLISFRAVGLGGLLARNFMTLRILNNAAIIGIGYIVGIRYAAIICAGSFLSYFVLVPLVHAIGTSIPGVLAPGAIPISEMSINEVFSSYVRIIGVGGIAGAGILGILSSLPSMIRSIGANIVGMKSQDTRDISEVPRIDRSLTGTFATVGLAIFAVAAFLFFTFGIGIGGSFKYAAVATGVVMVIAFLFAPVAARAIAIVGTNPVSGMTMLTLIITGFVLLKMGLTGGTGMFVTMMVGGVVCTALAASGALASDLKVGHWIGATPAKQLAWKFAGTLVAAIFCGIMMWVMAQADPGQGFGTANIPAPQASAMKEILIGIFGAQTSILQWYLFGLGVLLSLILRMAGVPPLAFALGMYLPMELNTPVLLGGILSWLVTRKGNGDDEATVKARTDRGVLIASGLIAGGAIIGAVDAIVAAVIKQTTGSTVAKEVVYLLSDHAYEGIPGELIATITLVGLCVFVVMFSRRAKPQE
ncbi:MAG: oligopeptide transporter, OPT family [bacterium]|nr:oligopeptide transporter, OPT family [bacterium]